MASGKSFVPFLPVFFRRTNSFLSATATVVELMDDERTIVRFTAKELSVSHVTLPPGLFVEFCSGSRQDFRKAGGVETLDEFRYETESRDSIASQ